MSAKNGKQAHGRRFTADEKMTILEEARQPGTTVAEVLRRHQLDGTTFYRWEKEAKAAVRDVLGGKPRGGDGRGAASGAPRGHTPGRSRRSPDMRTPCPAGLRPTLHRGLGFLELDPRDGPRYLQAENSLIQLPIFHVTPRGWLSPPRTYPTHTKA